MDPITIALPASHATSSDTHKAQQISEEVKL
jgi:hypothetical protein